jgi:hypothetical protein
MSIDEEQEMDEITPNYGPGPGGGVRSGCDSPGFGAMTISELPTWLWQM